MRKIVEEWKTIEDFPNYEISNMGRCRTKKTHYLKKGEKTQYRGVISHAYSFNKDGIKHRNSVGRLVALHFVPNPEGYKFIRYKDGNYSNFNYLNIEWIKTTRTSQYFRGKSVVSRSKQIETYRKIQRDIDMAIKYLEDDKLGEYISDVVLPIIKDYVNSSRRSSNLLIVNGEMEEFISYAMEIIYDMMSRGHALYSFKQKTSMLAKEYVANKFKQPKTTELNELIM
jgi:hypothetical protein